MDKALACHTGGRGSNPDKTKEDFSCLEKIQTSAPIPLGTPSRVLYFSNFLVTMRPRGKFAMRSQRESNMEKS